MRAVVTRVRSASVTIHGVTHGKIGLGFLVLLGIGPEDTPELCARLAEKSFMCGCFRMKQEK